MRADNAGAGAGAGKGHEAGWSEMGGGRQLESIMFLLRLRRRV